MRRATALSRRGARALSTSIANFPTFHPKNENFLPPGSFKGKVALVTGGGTGLGRAMALKYAELGASVCVASRKQNILDEAAQMIREKTNADVLAIATDVRSPQDVARMLDQVVNKFGLPDIIVNNAAGNFVAPFERLSANGFKTIVDIVLNGTANVTLDAGKRLIQAGKGAVFLSVTTTYASTGSGFVVPSAAAKAGVEAMIKSLAAEWGKYGMRFVGLAPGPFESRGAFDRLDPTGEFRESVVRQIPANRIGTVEEVANVSIFLTSDYASWMTGEIVRLDGGETVFNSGEFNSLEKVTKEQWDAMERMIRSANGANKPK